MDNETDDIKRWRLRAEELRALAGRTANAASHDVYQGLADTYVRLARQAEERAQRQRELATQKPAPHESRREPAATEPQPERRATPGHRYKIGQTVSYGVPAIGLVALPELFRIIHLVPTEGLENRYWVKSIADGKERIAEEGQLHSVPSDAAPTSKGNA